MNLIDTHCHLDNFADQLPDIIDRAAKAFVRQMIACGTEPADWKVHHSLASTYSNIHYTVGIHPINIAEHWETDLAQLEDYLHLPKAPVAIGEIGLDYHNISSNSAMAIATQKEVFRQQLIIAYNYHLPVIIHSRDAFDDCISIIDQSGIDWSNVVVHCFSEGPNEIRKINERGGRGSFTGIVTYKSAEKVRQALKTQGIERLMLETDSPYLAPVPYRSQCNEPSYIRKTAQFIAELLQIPENELSQITTFNAEQFFCLSH